MADTLTGTAKRQQVQLDHQKLKKYRDNLLEEHSQTIEVAGAHCPDKFTGTLGQLTNISERVSRFASTCISSPVSIEKSCRDLVEELKHKKEQDQFAARHRDYVAKFDDRAFVYLVLHEPKYRIALAAGAQQVTNKSDLFKVLKAMKSAEEDGDEEAAAVHLTPQNLKLREAWYEAIKAKGLSLDEYQALRIFKNSTNRTLHKSPPAREALQLLNTSLPVPRVYAAYKEPLVKVLQLLVKP